VSNYRDYLKDHPGWGNLQYWILDWTNRISKFFKIFTIKW